MRLRRLVRAMVVLGLLAGCSGPGASSTSPTADATGSGPRLTAVLHQTRLDVAPGIVQVLTGNDGPRTVTLTTLRLRWPGFPAPAVADLTARFPPDGYPLAPGRQADLPVRFPATVCTSTDAPDATPVVEAVADGRAVTVAVTDPDSLALLARLWQQACARQRISVVATVAYGTSWTASTVDGIPALRGSLVLTRADGDAGPPVSIVDVGGSVLIEQVAVGAGAPLLTLRSGARSAALAVDLLTTGRCDPHALSESTTTFVLSANLRLEGGPTVTFLVSPPQVVRDRILDTVYRGCGIAAPTG